MKSIPKNSPNHKDAWGIINISFMGPVCYTHGPILFPSFTFSMVFPLTALNWNFYFGLYTAHSENKFILNKLMTVCYWKLVQGTMKPSFSSLKAKSYGNCVFPPANMRVFVAVKVILTHLLTIRYRRILYSIYLEKMHLVFKKMQYCKYLLYCLSIYSCHMLVKISMCMCTAETKRILEL